MAAVGQGGGAGRDAAGAERVLAPVQGMVQGVQALHLLRHRGKHYVRCLQGVQAHLRVVVRGKP